MTSELISEPAGLRFGPYILTGELGRGGMGVVYRAFDTVKGRTVALKVLIPELAVDRAFQDRFRRESKRAARLSEPHIIPIHDYGQIDGRLFIDMRLVDGIDLATLLERDGPKRRIRAGPGEAGCGGTWDQREGSRQTQQYSAAPTGAQRSDQVGRNCLNYDVETPPSTRDAKRSPLPRVDS